jgi:Ser/Thr protein kinase RdoA (MazF antagonist)
LQAFETLSVRGQLGRLRETADAALAAYGLRPARLVPVAHAENTTFRVETPAEDRLVLRIHRVSGNPVHPPRSEAEVRSELLWLSALRRETGLAVPEPVPTRDGSLTTIAEVDGVPGPRVCVLFRWQPGRFFDAGLRPSHLERVGEFIATLHEHALGFEPPAGFSRWQIGDVSGDARAYVAGVVGERFGPAAVWTVETILDSLDRTRRELGREPQVFGLIHGDFHQENYLFHRGDVHAIDFDDCGWAPFVYDLSVTVSELHARPNSPALRVALLHGYRAVRPLPVEHERYLEVFSALRTLLLTLWLLEQRDHPSFPNWEEEARVGLAELEALAARLATGELG